MLDVCLLGCGGMMPLPERRLTALHVTCGATALLIDCGEGTQIGIRENGLSFKKIDTICITHFHADHISGLPGLLLSIGNAARTEPILMIGPKGLERVVKSLLVIAPELPFALEFCELDQACATIQRNDLLITAFRLEHRVTCYGYTVEKPRSGKFDTEKAKRNGVELSYWSRLQKGESIPLADRTLTPDLVLGKARKGLKLCYATDTRPTPRISEMAQGADLFICEGIYGEDEKKDKAVEKKHMLFSEAAALAKEANAAALWLTHYSPALVEPEAFLPVASAIFPATEAGFDGKKITLKFEDDTDEEND